MTRFLLTAMITLLAAATALAGGPHTESSVVLISTGCGPQACGHTHIPNVQTVGPMTGVVTWVGGAATFVFDNGVTGPPANVEAGSDPRTACNNGANEWPAVSTFMYTDGGLVSIPAANGADGMNVVTFDNNATNNMIVGGAIAVASQTFNSNLEFTDVDIIFNSAINLSTLGSAGRIDVESVACHEFGHAFGLNHTAVCTATMFPFSSNGQLHQRSLSADDIAGINAIYQTDINFWTTGTITGTIMEGGSPLYGAHVCARSVATGITVATGMSFPDGTYTISGVPVGAYTVYAEPLDGPVGDANITSTFFTTGKDSSFQTEFFGGNTTPTIVRVEPTTVTASVDITVSGAQSLNFSLVGEPSGPMAGFSATAGGFEIVAGTSTFIAVAGPGVSAIPDTAFSMPGSSVTFGPVSTSSGTIGADTFKIFPLVIAAGAPPGPRDVMLDDGTEVAVYCGVIDVVEPAMPVAAAFAYGTGSPGTAGVPALAALNPPAVGQPITLEITNGVSGENTILVFSIAPEFVDGGNGISLWVRIDGDSLLVRTIEFSESVVLASAMHSGSIPPVPMLAGVEVYVQGFLSDSLAAAGFTSTNGVQLRIF